MVDDKTYEDKVIRLKDLVDVNGRMEGFTFLKCHIEGPAVIIGSASEFSENAMNGPPDAVLWEIPQDDEGRVWKLGAILVQNCTFRGCEFRNVGLAGPKSFVEQFRGSMGE